MNHRFGPRNSARSKITPPLFTAVLLIPLLAVVVSAQTFRGTILGTVTDPNGAVVPGA